MSYFLIKKNRGTAILEASLTFPIVFYLIFFVMEILRLNDMQIALDSIAMEMAFDFMGSKKTDNFGVILKKYKPKYMMRNEITWYFSIYPDLKSMNNNEIITNTVTFEKIPGNDISVNDCLHPEKNFTPESQNDDLRTLSKKAFSLTVVCNYNFASEFVGRCFFGFTNKKEDEKFIIFSKCVGVCR